MADLPVKKIAVAGVLSAVSIVLGLTRLGFIPWFAGASLTIMHVPVIIGAILEGPLVGAFIGFIFGIFSLLQAAIAPNGPVDTAFINPLISVLPRVFVGPLAFLFYSLISGEGSALKKGRAVSVLREGAAILSGAIIGSLVNSILVLGALGLFKVFPWPLIISVLIANGPGEAIIAALLSLIIVSAWKRFPAKGSRARLADDEES
ncbi:ECF transporter S component [Treponema sp.]